MNKYSLRILAATVMVLFSALGARAQIGSAVTVTVNDSSASPTGINATASTLCNGVSTTLTVQGGSLGAGGAKWYWYSGGCGSGSPVDSGASITVTPSSTTNYYVRAQGGFCNHTTNCATTTITVNPVPTVTAPSNVVACLGSTVNAISLTGTPSGVTYSITGGASVGLANASGITQIPSFTATNSGSSTITATIVITPSANGCTGAADSFTVTILPGVSMNSVSDMVACNGTTTSAITFSGGPTGTTYNWTNNNTYTGLGASGTGNISGFSATNTTCGDTISTVIVTPVYTSNGQSCSGATDTFAVTIHPTPNGSLTGATICEGDSAPLIFNSTCGTGPFSLDVRTNTTPTATTGTYNNITSGSSFNLTTSPTATMTYDLMKITDANGCVRQ